MSAPLTHGRAAGVDGLWLHYVRCGSGPTVVMLHGWPGYWFDWRYVIARLSPVVDCLAVDLRGFGDSDAADGDPWSAYDEDLMAADVVAVLDHLGIERFALAGHDVGSAVAPAVARRVPGRAAGLALFNPTHPYIGERRNAPEVQRELWHHAFHALPWSHAVAGRDRTTLELYLGHFYRHWSGPTAAFDDEALRTIVDAYGRPGRLEASFGWYRSRETRHSRRPPTAPPALTLPTFVAWGDSDPVSPVEWAAGIERAYPNVDLRVLEGVGHFVPVEAPDAAAETVRAAAAQLL
jgi:pimeloyl-ACP methyl ester carboxylesterase